MKEIFNIYEKLKGRQQDYDCFRVNSLPFVLNHKIGISNTDKPLFFIKCESDSKEIDINLEFISVKFNRTCQLQNHNDDIETGIYTIVFLKSDSIELQQYFLGIIYLMVDKLPINPEYREVKKEIDKIINLFSKLSKPAIKTVQGLWAELIVIEQSSNPDYLVQSWHKSIKDKFDFNDGFDKIEVKSTSKNKRIHNFSNEQLNPNENSKLLIASIFTIETGIGKNIFGVVELIKSKLKNKTLGFRIDEVIVETLGKSFEKSFEVFFDYQLAVDSLKYYKCSNIPKIKTLNIPNEITNVRFDCNIEQVLNIKKIEYDSVLHKSLFK
ncbi:MAG: PD-(D/E)XK motif protein [Saprospiraceae bacterium]